MALTNVQLSTDDRDVLIDSSTLEHCPTRANSRAEGVASCNMPCAIQAQYTCGAKLKHSSLNCSTGRQLTSRHALKMTDKSSVTSSSHAVDVRSSVSLSFSISAILASSRTTSATTTTSVTAPRSHLSYGSALTAAAIAAAERAYITSAAAAAVAAFHHAPTSSLSSSSSAAIAATSLWAAAAAATAAQRHTFEPSSSDRLTSTDRRTSTSTLMPSAAIFPWMQERKDRLSGG